MIRLNIKIFYGLNTFNFVILGFIIILIFVIQNVHTVICKNFYIEVPKLLITFVFIITKVLINYSKKTYLAIINNFGCLSKLDRNFSTQCLQTCTSHHGAVTSLMQNFKHLALNGDSTEAEKYLSESCE